MPPRIAYVLGTSFSGSTLLNALLARHSEIVALNEVVNLGTELRDAVEKNPRHPLRQPLWQRVRTRYEAEGGDFERIDLSFGWHDALAPRAAAGARWREANERLFAALRAEVGDRVFIDASKHHRRLARMIAAGWSPRVVHIVRDGRSVVASGLKRGRGLPETMASLHLDLVRSERSRRALGAERFVRVRHADLARDPESTARRLCAFLGLAFEPAMLDLESPVEHPVAVGAKGFWMLRRGIRVAPARAARLPLPTEAAYRVSGGPARDRWLGV